MKKKNNRGFMLAETLIVTAFVAGTLIYMFIQFSNLSQKYNESYSYNTVEDLYALKNIRDYIKSDETFIEYMRQELVTENYIDITSCSNFTYTDYCTKLFSNEDIQNIYIFNNNVDYSKVSGFKESLQSFINKIQNNGSEQYRIIASFNNKTYSTIRFGV